MTLAMERAANCKVGMIAPTAFGPSSQPLKNFNSVSNLRANRSEMPFFNVLTFHSYLSNNRIDQRSMRPPIPVNAPKKLLKPELSP